MAKGGAAAPPFVALFPKRIGHGLDHGRHTGSRGAETRSSDPKTCRLNLDHADTVGGCRKHVIYKGAYALIGVQPQRLTGEDLSQGSAYRQRYVVIHRGGIYYLAERLATTCVVVWQQGTGFEAVDSREIGLDRGQVGKGYYK